ncbi:hypothetical protein [Methanohalobium sp.]|uniref:hypothetical protein n=1 Tax=Methanohalobium sp. TaxID=2837493 RepID=UPI00397E6B5C
MRTLNKLFVIKAFLIASMLFILSGCEENEDNYNYDNIEPRLVGGISGPKEAAATGFNKYKYSVIHRGGSDYTWSVDKDEYVESLQQDSDYPNEAYIQYAELHDTSMVAITVEETTKGGEKTSTTDSVQLLPYCPYPVENYIGYYTSSNTSDVADTVYIDTTDLPNQLRVYGLADFITNPERWGENWILGDGSCNIDLYCENIVKIEQQWIGDSDYPATYYIEGSGTIDTTTNVITLFYNILYDDTGTKTVSTSLTYISE